MPLLGDVGDNNGGGSGGGSSSAAPPSACTRPGGCTYPVNVGSRPTGQFLLDYNSGVIYRASDGHAFASPVEAFAAGVARDWANVDFIFGPPNVTASAAPGDTGNDLEKPIPIRTTDPSPPISEDPVARLADLFQSRFGYTSAAQPASQPETVTTYTAGGGGAGGAGNKGVAVVLLGVAAVVIYFIWKYKKGAQNS